MSAVAALICGVIFGIAPSLGKLRSDVLTGARLTGAPHLRARNWLVSAQIAMSVVLLTGASLLLESLWNLQNIRLGLRPQNVMSARISLSHSRYPNRAQQFAFFQELEQRVARLPGISSVAISDSVPPGGRTMAMIFSRIAVEGRPSAPQGTGGMVVFRSVTPAYFDTLGIPLMSGRVFTELDRRSTERVTILSDSLARRLFPNENPLGRRIRPGVDGPWRMVIGVVANVKNAGLIDNDDPEYYELVRNSPDDALSTASVLVRTSDRSGITGQLIREQVAQMDRVLPVAIETLSSRVSGFIARPRFNTIVLGFFALIGLLLAAVGLFGVLAFLVAQRSQELGVRMALGATQSQIARLVLSHAARWTALGALAGTAGAALSVSYVRTLLYGVEPRDPRVLATVIAVLAAVALAAAWLPCRRAARLDPVAMLRHD
jgi:predicted permease